MRENLLRVINDMNKDDVVKVEILTGTGRDLFAGADFAELASAEKIVGYIYERLAVPPRPAFFKLENPFIAAINVAYIGAGLSLALSCDIRIASDTSIFGSTFIKLRIHPNNAMSYWLPRILGTANALEFLHTGKIIIGEEAKQLGIITWMAPPEEMMNISQELVNNPTANCGALGEKDPPHKVTDKVAFILPAS